jgi:hypothetical protein
VFEKYKDPAHSDFNVILVSSILRCYSFFLKDFTVLLRDVLTKDIRKHQTLAVAWLYEEYTSAMHKRRFGDVSFFLSPSPPCVVCLHFLLERDSHCLVCRLGVCY